MLRPIGVKLTFTVCPKVPLPWWEGLGKGERTGQHEDATHSASQSIEATVNGRGKKALVLSTGETVGWSEIQKTRTHWKIHRGFVCFSHRLVIELDGGQHAQPRERSSDQQRDAWLREQGFKVLRFWNGDVLRNIKGVVETIHHELLRASCSPPPNLPHQGGGTY
jgi:hypothetical protein